LLFIHVRIQVGLHGFVQWLSFFLSLVLLPFSPKEEDSLGTSPVDILVAHLFDSLVLSHNVPLYILRCSPAYWIQGLHSAFDRILGLVIEGGAEGIAFGARRVRINSDLRLSLYARMVRTVDCLVTDCCISRRRWASLDWRRRNSKSSHVVRISIVILE
jgi:hypothetical protein